MILIDTDVMIDMLREYRPAILWLNSIDDEIVLSGYVVMELIQGCKTRAEQKRLQNVLKDFVTVWPNSDVCDAAVDIFTKFHLSHNLGIIDSLIGQTAVALNLPLYTFNTRHYSVIPDLRLVEPYLRG
jgi:predicted nucleic acid-binding protein